jgi:Uma2 family endonuclease
MFTRVALPNIKGPIKFVLDAEGGFSDTAYRSFCAANPDLNVERTSQGEIVVVPPAGGESSFRQVRICRRLDEWAERDGRGIAFSPTVQFMLPSGAALSPDASWASKERLSTLNKRQRRAFLRIVPEFVIEILSPSDRLSVAKRKMDEWMANGVDLAWLIDGDAETVYVYSAGTVLREHHGLREIAGEGPVHGFVLDLTAIWQGL